jgi:hypothetical protein
MGLQRALWRSGASLLQRGSALQPPQYTLQALCALQAGGGAPPPWRARSRAAHSHAEPPPPPPPPQQQAGASAPATHGEGDDKRVMCALLRCACAATCCGVRAPLTRLRRACRMCAARRSYRGPALQLFRLLVRFKVAQLSGVCAAPPLCARAAFAALTRHRRRPRRTGIAAAAVPLAAHLSGEALPPLASAGLGALVAGARATLLSAPVLTCYAYALVVNTRRPPTPRSCTGAGAASGALWYYSRRYVGELSLTHAGRGVRISTLDFWGRREATRVPRADVVPPLRDATRAQLAQAAAAPVLPLDGVPCCALP